jgi:hypothetical protein
MKIMIQLTVVLFGMVLTAGCSRPPDPSQVTMAKNDAGQAAYVLVAPIQGRPFADGAQYLMDNVVKSQTGGDIESIKVDRASVQVIFSQIFDQNQDFIIIGKARISLVGGSGQFDVPFRNEFHGPVGPGRTMPNCLPLDNPDYPSAYTQGASAWIQDYDTRAKGLNWGDKNTSVWELCNQLSLSALVTEITNQGAVKMPSLDEWRKADAYAWKQFCSQCPAAAQVDQAQ